MKKFSLVYLLLGGLFCAEASAAERGRETVDVKSVDIRRRGEAVDVDMTIGYDRLVLRNYEQLTVTPLIISGRDTVSLPPVVFRGDVFDIVAQRNEMFYGIYTPEDEPYETIVFSRIDRKEREQAVLGRITPVQTREDNIQYAGTFLYPVASDATVVLQQELQSCRDGELVASQRIGSVMAPVPPRISFLIPVERQAPRRAKLTAHINFEQDKYVVRPEIAQNSSELQKIYDFTREMLSDEDIEVRRIIVRSYASPEARYSYNAALSENRARAVRDNVIDRMTMDRAMFDTESVPEDWDSLRTWIASSDLSNRAQLLDIIDTTSDPDVREAKIKEYDRSTYNMLYSQVYPNLRRTDVEIEYDLKAVTVERGLVLIETDPSKMNLDDMIRVAEYYPRDSKDYERAMVTTMRHYPYEVVPNNNMAALSLLNGDTYSARQYLDRYQEHPQCLNNMGVAAYWDGEYEAAEEYFRRAAEMGCDDARFNLTNMEYLDMLR